jgi:Helix-turn-helix domain
MSISPPPTVAGATALILARALYSLKETKAILNVSHASCYRLISAGKLDARKLLGKTVITGESITRLIAELPKVGRQR